MAPTVVAVTTRIKTLLGENPFKDASEATVESTISALKAAFREYQFTPPNELIAVVKESINKMLAASATPKPPPPVVAGLNSLMSRAGGSKRTRPVDDSIAVVTEGESNQEDNKDNQKDGNTEGDDKFTGEPGAVPIKAATEKSAPTSSVKRKKLTTSRSSELHDSINPLLGNPGGNFLSVRPVTRLKDLAGIDSILQQIKELVFFPTMFPELYSHLGVSPPCGILLNGPSGCGKTMLASAIAGELGLPFYKASGPELVGGTSGESEERIRQIFESAANNAPSVLFIDAIDVIASNKDSQRGMERRIVAQLSTSIDELSSLGNTTSTDTPSNTTAVPVGVNDAITNAIIGNIGAEHKAVGGVVEVVSLPVGPAKPKLVILIAATNKPESIDAAVRGRFSREVALPVPDAPARAAILKLMTAHMRLSEKVDFKALGKLTPGFVGADLQGLAREAGMLAVSRIVGQGDLFGSSSGVVTSVVSETVNDTAMEVTDVASSTVNTSVTTSTSLSIATPSFLSAAVEMDDFTRAAKSIQPTAKREGFAVAPDVTWSDVGALAKVREELLHNVLEPISHPERFRHLGLDVPAGVLFFGPPGCGKTLLAKALANQSGANFISVKGPELLSMYVGESESKVRQVFSRARASAPCVIFFDELDALCPKRGSGPEGMSGGGGNNVSDRVVNQLLTELDGLETRKGVYIIAATNRLELIDDAMLRPGRLGKLLYVPLPTSEDRMSILQALTKKVSITWNSTDRVNGVDLQKVALDSRADGFSGADLAALVREAGLAVVRELVDATKHRAVSHSGTGSAITSEDIIGRAYVSTNDLTTLTVTENTTTPAAEAEAAQSKSDELQTIQGRHFEAAFGKVRASVSVRDRERFDLVNSNIQGGMGAIQALNEAAKEISKKK